jgi:hypothetical protein
MGRIPDGSRREIVQMLQLLGMATNEVGASVSKAADEGTQVTSASEADVGDR